MHIALIGTRGVPARYGGFETCVEQVGLRLVKAGHEVVVYCRSTGATKNDEREYPTEFCGMRLVHLPALHRKSLETLSHTAASVAHLMTHPVDAAIVFNSANAPFIPVLRARGIAVATHVDGLEWKRSKWQGAGRRYYRLAESMAVRWSDALVADAQGIADYYQAEFGAATDLIAYGAPIVSGDRPDLLAKIGLRPHEYHLVVARFEPENNVDLIVDGYRRSAAKLPLVVVGAAPYADDYTARVHGLADERVRFLGSVWDQDLLDQLYASSHTYLHGHSVGGTNPSLLRAIGAGAATIAFDVVFNREVVREAGRYFRTADDVAAELERAEAAPDETRRLGRWAQRCAHRYNWDDVAGRYEQLCVRLASINTWRRRAATARYSGRRNHIDLEPALQEIAGARVEPPPVLAERDPFDDLPAAG
jgi:glycosyltransferase involved in cell wall biosynthesis